MVRISVFIIFSIIISIQNKYAGNYILVSRELDQSNCNYITCPTLQGYCKADKCVCFEGYLNFSTDGEKKYCNYKQKSAITALLLETFGLIGFGHFYAGRVFSGFLKIVCFYVIICYGTQFVIQFMKENTYSDIAYYIKIIISVVCIGTPLVWHFIDLYNWASNNYLDGNGMPLLDW